MPGRDLIVIGASAGGLTPLQALVKLLPADLPASIVVAMHMSPHRDSMLPQILSHAGALRAANAIDGEVMRSGRLYISPPDHHLLVEDSRLRLSRGPKINGYRPSIDALFRSAALSRGDAVIGVILSGTLSDGTLGLEEIHKCGGLTIVQHPNEAASAEMPLNALRQVEIDYCAGVTEIAGVLLSTVAQRRETVAGMTTQENRRWTPTLLRCPACNGPLSEPESGMATFRCLVGHEYSHDGLRNGYADAVENALYDAAARLQEQGILLRRLADQVTEDRETSERLRTEALKSEEHARELVHRVENAS